MKIGFTTTSFIRGHKIIWSSKLKKWKYADTKEIYVPTPFDSNDRPCIKCGEMPTPEGHDACLGVLPGVKFACCGHGVSTGHRSEK